MSVADAPATARAAAAPGVACTHCGLDVPAGLVEPGAEHQYCCGGCRAAWHVIHACGLDRYYALAGRRGAPVDPSGRSFEEFDHPSFRDLYVRPRAGGLAEVELYLEGVHCASCVWLVERVPLVVPGVASAELDASRARVRIAWDAGAVALSRVARVLDTLGYRPHPFRGGRADALRRAEDRAMLAHIGVAGALAGNVMLVAVALYGGWFTGIEAEFERVFRWISLGLTTPALLFPGRVFFRGALGALRARSLHMDVPIALALAAGWARGAWNTVAGHGPIYFDGVAMLVFLLLVGRFLQTRAQRAAADSAELHHALRPAVARVVEDGAVREVPVQSVLPGALLEVRPGDTLAADGTVADGRSDLDLSLLTGESRPAEAGPGDPVWAGTVNRTSTLRVRVETAGEATRLGRILRDVEEGARRRAPVVRTADRMAGAFVAAVLALAALTFALWAGRDPSAALDHAIALLIVTCPCALALATPLAVTVAIGRAAARGILIRGGDALETLARPAGMLIDKTGTLTEGRPSLARWEGPDWVRPLVLAAERDSAHPVAEGFRAAWPDVVVPEAAASRHVAGGGVEAIVGGRRVVVGAPAFVAARRGPDGGPRGGAGGAGDPAAGALAGAPGVAPPPVPDGLSPVWVVVDDALAARAAFGDRVRPDARAALEALRGRGWSVGLLSGDDPAVARAVGRELGFADADVRGGASPEDKRRAVEDAATRGPVVMVGDGVNDAAAIARATVGVGVHGGAEASLAAADVYLSRPGAAELVALADGAARTLAVIRRNIAFSLAYNVAGAALAMAGLVHPLVAAVLMPASSLTVVIASWKSRTFGEGPR